MKSGPEFEAGEACSRRALIRMGWAGMNAAALSTLNLPLEVNAGSLEQPASIVKRAPHSVMNKVVRTGSRLVAVGERGVALWSDDNGRQWQQASVPVSVTLTSLAFVDDGVGWATGHSGVILQTTDGGKTWTKQVDGIVLAKLALAQAEHPAASVPQRDARLRQSQRLVDDGPDKPLLALCFKSARRGMAVGAYGLAATTDDGGRNWAPCLDRLDNTRGMHLYGVANTGSTWFAVGEQGFLARSIDDAETFARLDSPSKGSFFALLRLHDGGMLAAGLLGNACRVGVDGAIGSVDLPAKLTTFSALQLGTGAVVLIEASGRILVSKDKGRSFKWADTPSHGPVTSIVEAADGTLVAAGLTGVRRLVIEASRL